MQVVEDDEEGPVRREHLEIAPSRPLGLLLRTGNAADTDRGRDAIGHEFVPRDSGNRIALRAGGHSDHLREGQVRDPFAVGLATADDNPRSARYVLHELPREA